MAPTVKGKNGKQMKRSENIALEKDNQKGFEETVKSLPTEKLTPGTLYVGHLPRGFYEDEIKGYFTQFGDVTKVRLARSKKTGGYKGYGFIQFASEEVAKIAAEAMDNYLMFDRLLQCKFVPEDQLNKNVWKGHRRKFVYVDRAEIQRQRQNAERTLEETNNSLVKLLRKEKGKRSELKRLGIDYDFPGFRGAVKKVAIKAKQKSPKTMQTPGSVKKKKKTRMSTVSPSV